MKDYKLKSGNIFRVIQDTDPESPNEWENEDVFLVYDHRQFTVKREGFAPQELFDYLSNNKQYNNDSTNEKYDNYYIFLIDAYIHSGVSLSLANTKNLTDRRWDVSTTGYILVKKEICKDVELDITIEDKYPENEDKGRYFAKGLIKTWNQYLSGDVYGFQVLKPNKTYTITEEELDCISELSNLMNDVKDGLYIPDSFTTQSVDKILQKSDEIENIEYEEIDSCYGFYGDDPKINGMLEHIDDEIIE